jgi:beta-phosphoglucomutase
VRGIVFDLDGVLVDSEPVHEVALRAAVESLGMTLSRDVFVARCVGRGDDACLRSIAALHGRVLDDADLDLLRHRKVEAFEAALARRAPPGHAGAAGLVLAAGERAPTGVCSGSRRREVLPLLRSLGVHDALDAIVTADEVPQPKPDPAGYLLAARRLDVAPSSCVAIEDTPTGVAAAAAAGYRVFAVAHTFAPEHLAGAHEVADRIAELTVERLLAV